MTKKDKSSDQHFMVDKKFIDIILEYANLNKDDLVLELGGGDGALTRCLYGMVKFVYVIEKDPEFYNELNRRFTNDNIKIIHGDALYVDLPEFNKLISNPPYQILEQFFIRLVKENRYNFELGVFTVPSRFKGLITTQPQSKNFGLISALFYSFFDVEVLDKVSKDAFDPKPRVSSYIIRIKPSEQDTILKKMIFEGFKSESKKVKNVVIDTLWNYKSEEHSFTRKQAKEVSQSIFKEFDSDFLEKTVYSFSKEEFRKFCSAIQKLEI
ncbi:MAG: rRNA adenine N-6-methyltransferase family protein [Candidatus Micrarchaeia archaeon]